MDHRLITSYICPSCIHLVPLPYIVAWCKLVFAFRGEWEWERIPGSRDGMHRGLPGPPVLPVIAPSSDLPRAASCAKLVRIRSDSVLEMRLSRLLLFPCRCTTRPPLCRVHASALAHPSACGCVWFASVSVPCAALRRTPLWPCPAAPARECSAAVRSAYAPPRRRCFGCVGRPTGVCSACRRRRSR